MAIISELISKSFSLDDKMLILENKLETLTARASDVISELEMAEFQPGKKRRREVDHWLKNVKQKKSEIESIGKEVKKLKLPLSYMQLNSYIGRISNEIEELVKQGNFPNGLVLNDARNTKLPLVTPKLVAQMFEDHIRMIGAWLIDDEVYRIGVYGMGGVGKTTLMMHIHNKFINDGGIAGDVYWVTVTHGSSNELQNKIALAVGLDLAKDLDQKKRAATLSSTLSRMGKMVLILDDMWKHCSLDEVGIPLGSSRCKIVVTTRSLDVCRRMRCQRSLKVEPLPDKHAQQLFLANLDNVEVIAAETVKIVELVAKECRGLPLGIRTMSQSMSGVIDVHEWNNALQDLRKPMRGQEDMENEVFPILQVSYRHLNDARLQQCFLSCILYPEGHEMPRDELISLWIAEGMLDEIESREEQFHKGHTILNRLENACLLEAKSYRNGRYVKMHDLIRDMAVNITRSSSRFMTHPKEELREVPDEQQWKENLEKVSFFHNNISEIPSGFSPRCPNLSTLLLQWNPLERIPDSFFAHMRSLIVVNLSYTNITRIPENLSNLENLSALLVGGCWKLTYVPSLTKLKKLKELDMSHTKIKEAPQGMDGLFNLQLLDLSHFKDLSVTFTDLLPSLSHLQILTLSKPIKGKDLIGLRHLEKLHCWALFDVSEWITFIESRHHWKLKNYSFIVQGTDNRYGNQCKQLRLSNKYVESWHRKRLIGSDRTILITNCIFNRKSETILPQNIQFLGINECDFHVRGLIDALPSLHNTTELRVCEIKNSEGIEYIWSPKSPYSSVTYPLKLSHVTKLHISNCPRVKKLFPCVLLEQKMFPNLQEIEIINCPYMEELIAANDDVQGNASANKNIILSLPNLRVLSLYNLPKLESICRGLLLGGALTKFTKKSCPLLAMISLSRPLICDSSEDTLCRIPTHIEWWMSLDKEYPKDVQILRHAIIKYSSSSSIFKYQSNICIFRVIFYFCNIIAEFVCLKCV